MTRRHLLFGLAILVGSCTGSETPTGVDAVPVHIPVNPALIPSPADAGARPINRIRAVARRVPDNAVMGERVVDVQPTADQWEIVLEVLVANTSVDVVVSVFLMNVTGGQSTVEFSGEVGPLTVTKGVQLDVPDLPIVRGPPANLLTTGVQITQRPDTLLEGVSAPMSAQATTSGSTPPTVFWTTLDSTVLSNVDSVVTALLPGTGRVVASAGAYTDTASIVVRPAPATIAVSPAVDSVTEIGAQVLYSAAVLDARGDTLPLEQVTWRSGSPTIIESRGNGLFQSLAVGIGVVEAVSVTRPTVVGSAQMVVGAPVAGPDVSLLTEVSDFGPSEGDTVQLIVYAYNDAAVPGAAPVTNLAVTNAVSAGMTVLTSTPSQGTFDPQTGVWSLGGLNVDGSASLGLSVEIPAVSAGTQLVDSTWISAMDQVDVDRSNDTTLVVFTVQPRNVDVQVRKAIDVAQPAEGTQVAFRVSVVNRGRGAVSDIVVFDTIPAAFTGLQHSVSAGTLDGDTLWTIPLLAENDSATWTTTATVATGVAGSSATNSAVLRALAQNDTTPANDTSTVLVTFPLSAVPVVTITSPPDSAVFDPGDLVSFVASATDAEDGDLSPQIQWASSVDGALGTGRNVTTSTLTTGVHRISASVTDQSGTTGADTIQITIALITTPAVLNVPFGGTASLPISLSEPAQTGGLTLSVTSADPGITSPSASTVFIPGGAFSANATLSGITPGTTDVTVSHPQFGSAVTTVSVTAALNILPTTVTIPQTFPQPVDIRLESQGSPIAAPAGGLPITYSSSDPGCLAVPANGAITGGLVSTTAQLSYGGVTQTPCSAWFRVSATSVVADSVNVSVTATPTISLGGTTVGAGLQYGNFNAGLSSGGHGGVTVRLQSSDPSVMLVSPNFQTAGQPFIDVFVPAGQTIASYYVQGVEGTTGTPQIQASAPGFASSSATITVVQSGYDMSGPSTTQTTFSPDQVFQVRTGIPNGQLTGLQIIQAIRVGGPTLTATVTSSDPAVADLVTLPDSASPVTVAIAPGQSTSASNVAAGGVALNPSTAGSTTISATIPGLIQTNNATRVVTVTAPNLSVSGTTVGAGLQYGNFNVGLGASQHGGVTVRIESTDPSVLLISPNFQTAGQPFIDVPVADGQTIASYYVQGVEGTTGTPQIRVTAPGFVEGTATVSVVQSGYDMSGPSTTQTTFSPDQVFQVRTGIPNGQLTGLQILQAVRVGAPTLTATVTSSDPAVADLVTLPDSASPVTVAIAPGQSTSASNVAAGGVALNPSTAGSTTITATIPGLLQTSNATRVVTVTAPSLSVSGTTVGAGLQYGNFNVGLGASQHGGVTVRVESTDPSVLLISPNFQTAGQPFIDVPVADGQTIASYYVQGVEGTTGTPQIRVTAPGFVEGTATVSVVQPGYDISGLSTALTTFSPDQVFQVRTGVPNGQLTGLQILQAVRIGGPTLAGTVTSSNTGVGILTTSSTSGGTVPFTIVPGASSTPGSVATGGVAFDALGNGSSTVTASLPGLLQTTNAIRIVTVTAPGITLSSTTVGAGLQYGNFNASLGASQHGGVTVTIKSSNPGVFRVSPNSVTAGTDSIMVFVPNGQSVASYYVHGVPGALGTAALQASAPGFTDAVGATVTVVQPALDMIGLLSTISAGAQNDAFQVRVGIPNAQLTGMQIEQALSFGSAPLDVTVTSSNPTAAELTDGVGTAGSVVVPITAGTARTNVSVPPGVALDPLAAGSTSVSAAITGFITLPGGTQTVTITP